MQVELVCGRVLTRTFFFARACKLLKSRARGCLRLESATHLLQDVLPDLRARILNDTVWRSDDVSNEHSACFLASLASTSFELATSSRRLQQLITRRFILCLVLVCSRQLAALRTPQRAAEASAAPAAL